MTVYGADGRARMRGGEQQQLGPGAVTDVSLGGCPRGLHRGRGLDGARRGRRGPGARGDPVPDSLDDTPQADRAWVAATALADGSAGATDTAAGRRTDEGTIALVPGRRTSSASERSLRSGPTTPNRQGRSAGRCVRSGPTERCSARRS
ncbi:hypothetical protein NKG05_21150 [Oerskovia sp. M15]